MDLVSVAIRIKPPHTNEIGKSVDLVSEEPPIIVVPERQVSFSFDHIFSENSTQEDVYNKMVRPLVQNIVNGYNSTIFAYGQTGTGKTFTIGSDPTYSKDNDAGLISRALNEIMLWDNDSQIITMSISFIEIYNEKVFDLLGDNKIALQVKGFNVSGVKKHFVSSSTDAQSLLIQGGKNRHTGETKKNSKSSRSHAIFTIYCNVKHFNQETEAKLNLVDLAGSESVKKTGNEGSQLHEGININKGLLCIGQVINALSSNHSYIPYRQSTITTILQDSLNKNNFVTLIACIGTKMEDLVETVQTLDFAQRAKRVKNKPEVNSIVGEYTKQVHTNITTRKVASTPFRTPLRPMSLVHQNIRKRPLHSISSNLTNSYSTIQETAESLSPIVKRCVDAVSNSLLNSVKSIVIQSFMTKLPEKSRQSPRISRSSLDRVVKQLVHNNLQLQTPDFNTFRNAIDCNRDRSPSCTDDDDCVEKENRADNAQLAGVLKIATSPIMSCNVTPAFKKPFTPLRIAKPGRRTFAASSPIEDKESPVDVRRSARISSRNSSMRTNSICDCCVSPKRRKLPVKSGPSSEVRPRRSTRLSTKLTPIYADTPPKLPPRRSTRLSVRVEPKSATTTKRKTKVNKKNNTSTQSPIKSLGDKQHTIGVLKVLNEGALTSIMKLNTIGAKYAAMILQFRQLRGHFFKIHDLSQMPWRGNGYRNFISANFLVPGTP